MFMLAISLTAVLLGPGRSFCWTLFLDLSVVDVAGDCRGAGIGRSTKDVTGVISSNSAKSRGVASCFDGRFYLK